MSSNVVETVVRTGRLLRDEDGADVIILGCAGLGGYRAAMEAELGLPSLTRCRPASLSPAPTSISNIAEGPAEHGSDHRRHNRHP